MPVVELKPGSRDDDSVSAVERGAPGWPRWIPMTATAVAVVAVVLPPTATARWLVTGAPPPAVVSGVWFFKGLLLLHASLVLLAGRHRHPWGPAFPFVDPERVHGREPRRELALLVAVLGLGTVARLVDLGAGLWYDEILTLVRFARLPLGDLITTYTSQNQHMLYSVMGHVSMAAFGQGAWALRLPAAVLGVASLWAVYWFGKRIVSGTESLLAALLLAVSYHHVWFSQNARGYTGLLLATLLASGLFLSLLRGEDGGRWRIVVGYAGAMAAGVYMHMTAAFVAVAHLIVWGALLVGRWPEVRGRVWWRPGVAILLAGTLSLLLYALVLPQFVHTLLAPTMPGLDTDWKRPGWLVIETVRGLSAGVPGGYVALVGGGIVFAVGLASYWRRQPAVGGMLVLPAVLLLVAMLGLGRNLWPRMFLFSAGFGALVVVRGIFTAGSLLGEWGRRAAVAVCLVIAGVSAMTVPTAWNPKQDYVGAKDFVEAERRPGDAVVTVDMTNVPYQEYLPLHARSVASVEELMEIERNHDRTWVLYTFPTRLAVVQPEIWGRLTGEYATAAEYAGTVGGGAVVVKVKG